MSLDGRFRLADSAGQLGINCTEAGLSLAGAPLLRVTAAGFAPRPQAEIETLMKSAFGDAVDPNDLTAGLGVVAEALNRGDLGRAMVAAVHLRLPSLSMAAAERVAQADEALSKYDVGELRDWHGRWTTGGAGSPSNHGEQGRKPASGRGSSKAPAQTRPGSAKPVRFDAGPERPSLDPTPMAVAERLAIGEEVMGGGPEDPFADAAATLGVGLVVTTLKPHQSKPTTAAGWRGNSGNYRSKPSESYDEECEELYNRELINCKIVGAIKRNRWKAKVCRSVAFQRYSECLADGPSNISTPEYEGN